MQILNYMGNQKGIAQILVIILLLAGLGAGIYLSQQTQIFKPKAYTPSVSVPITPPGASLSLEAPSYSYMPGDTFRAQLLVRSDVYSINLIVSRLDFADSIQSLEVLEISTGPEPQTQEAPRWKNCLIQYWTETFFDNNAGKISLIGGVPSPGLRTDAGKQSCRVATILFKVKDNAGIGTQAGIYFSDDSALYRDADNVDILQGTSSLLIKIGEQATPTPSPTPSPADRVCAQVMTPAVDPKTGGCKEFPTPCDVPQGWKPTGGASCRGIPSPPPFSRVSPTPSPTPTPTPPPFWCNIPIANNLLPCPSPAPRPLPLPSSVPVPVSTGSKGDGNGDGKFDFVDLSVLYSQFAKPDPLSSIDFNNDRVVNVFDHALMVQLFIEKGIIRR